MSDVVVWILVVLCVVLAAVALLIGVRNNPTLRYRLALLDQIRRASSDDIANSRPWQWRYDAFSAVSYERMLWCFWRRRGSHYPDWPELRFTKPGARP